MTGLTSKTLLLLAAVAAPAAAQELPPRLNPAFAAYISTPAAAVRAFTPLSAAPAPAPSRPLGQIPSPIEYSRLSGRDFSSAIARRTSVSAVTPPVAFSASYDLRTLGKLPAVRNQGEYGDCWAFATLASMESWLLPIESWDFSESNMAKNSGFDGSPMWNGGNTSMSSAYLLRWSGPVNETDDPHDTAIRSGLTVRKHSQEVRWVPPPASVNESAFKNNIKSSIESYGAVYSSLYWDDAASDGSSTNFYNDRCTKPYGVSGSVCTCGAGGCGGHAIALVGWNDNYSAANFVTGPPGNGAFIARNSWGTGYGESGYFYISYYDSSLGGDNAVFKSAESAANYSAIYQYDPLGYTYDLGNGDTGGPDSTTEWMANIFTASASGPLKSAGFYATDAGTSYTIYVYTGVTPGSPRSGTLAYTASGSFTLPGFYTVLFGSEVGVLSGETFSVVVRLTNTDYPYPVAVEKPYAGFSSGATASAGQSYFSNNGTGWTDVTSLWANTNASLKVYQEADSTAPSPVATVNDGTGADVAKTGSTTQLSANWTASADAESGIAAYYYAIGTASGAVNIVNWTSNGASRSVTRTGLSLTAGTTYYFGVKAVNGVGTYSAPSWSNGQFVDTSAPEDIPFVYDGTDLDIDYVRSVTTLSARWGASSFAGGSIARYEYAIGTTPGGAQTVPWTSVGLVYTYTKSGLALAEGTTYYFAVRAYNNLEIPSGVAISDGQVPDITAPSARVLLTSPLPAKAAPLSGKLVLTETPDRLPQPPALSFRTSTGRVVPVPLTFLTGSTWTIAGYVETFHSTGTAVFAFAATDAAGNAGTTITSGGSFVINTALNSAAGGFISNSDGCAVLLPAGASAGNLLVSISTAAAALVASADAASPDSVKFQSQDLAREFTALTTNYTEVTSFLTPVTITMSYPDTDNDGRMDMDLLPETSAWLYYLDPAAGRWTPVPNVSRDTAANTLSAPVSHFSIYSVRSTGETGRGMGALKAYPNPCDLRSAPGLTIAGLPVDASGTKVYIYNTAGELVRTLSPGDGVSPLNVVSWDGRDSRGARAASGLYIYLIRTTNYGKGTGKFFIIW
jgi:C1A family cysteine protease